MGTQRALDHLGTRRVFEGQLETEGIHAPKHLMESRI